MNIEKDNKLKKITYPIFEMKEKGKLILTTDIINQIMFLHANVGKTEWSAILLYDVISGNPSVPADFVLQAKHIFLMDVGTAGYTEYETDGDIVDLYDNVEGAMEMKIGHIHSHHDMSTFFSGTDTDELMTNVDKHNYYLSLIVNFSGNYACKCVFLSEVKNISWMHYTDDKGQLKKFKSETTEKQMIAVNMSIVLEYNNDFFFSRLDQVKKKIELAKKAKAAVEKKQNKSKPYNNGYNGYMFDGHGSYTPANVSLDLYKSSDPKHMTTADVETLTRNILSISSDLKETRSVYTLLFQIADSTDDELSCYYDLLSENIEEVMDAFFDSKPLADDELIAVVKEIAMSINRFIANVKIKAVIVKISNVLYEYQKLSSVEWNNDVVDRTEMVELEIELEKIQNGKN